MSSSPYSSYQNGNGYDDEEARLLESAVCSSNSSSSKTNCASKSIISNGDDGPSHDYGKVNFFTEYGKKVIYAALLAFIVLSVGAFISSTSRVRGYLNRGRSRYSYGSTSSGNVDANIQGNSNNVYMGGGNNYQIIDHVMSLSTSSFQSRQIERKTASNDDTGGLIYLDRHRLDCRPQRAPLTGFQMFEEDYRDFDLIGFTYYCATLTGGVEELGDEDIRETTLQWARKGLASLPQYSIFCDDGWFMTEWNGHSEEIDVVKETYKFQLEYSCWTYPVSAVFCTNYTTDYTHVGDDLNSIRNMKNLEVRCPEKSGLKGWEGQAKPGQEEEYVRIAYTCCSSNVAEPSQEPTHYPTMDPTHSSPTEEPTHHPTHEPSKRPSHRPTYEPTAPTMEPTVTSKPTLEPSAVPTLAPSQLPTMEPSYKPSHRPTVRPTDDFVSAEPSLEPTKEPTADPTQVPTLKPTPAPTKWYSYEKDASEKIIIEEIPVKEGNGSGNSTANGGGGDVIIEEEDGKVVSVVTESPTDAPTMEPSASGSSGGTLVCVHADCGAKVRTTVPTLSPTPKIGNMTNEYGQTVPCLDEPAPGEPTYEPVASPTQSPTPSGSSTSAPADPEAKPEPIEHAPVVPEEPAPAKNSTGPSATSSPMPPPSGNETTTPTKAEEEPVAPAPSTPPSANKTALPPEEEASPQAPAPPAPPLNETSTPPDVEGKPVAPTSPPTVETIEPSPAATNVPLSVPTVAPSASVTESTTPATTEPEPGAPIAAPTFAPIILPTHAPKPLGKPEHLLNDDDLDTDDIEDQQEAVNDDREDRAEREDLRRDPGVDDPSNEDDHTRNNDDLTNPYTPTYEPVAEPTMEPTKEPFAGGKTPEVDDEESRHTDDARAEYNKFEKDHNDGDEDKGEHSDDFMNKKAEDDDNLSEDEGQGVNDDDDDGTVSVARPGNKDADRNDGGDELPTMAPSESELKADYMNEVCATVATKDLRLTPAAKRLTLCNGQCPLGVENCFIGCASTKSLIHAGLVSEDGKKSWVRYIYVGENVKSTLFSQADEQHKTIYYTYSSSDNGDSRLNNKYYETIRNSEIVDGEQIGENVFSMTVESLSGVDPTFSC